MQQQLAGAMWVYVCERVCVRECVCVSAGESHKVKVLTLRDIFLELSEPLQAW